MIKYPGKRKNDRRGFTVLEICFVIVISGIMLAAGATMLKDYIISGHIRVTRAHMAEIDTAIVQYGKFNNGKLPCVADLTAPVDFPPTSTPPSGHERYGVEVNGGNCLGIPSSVANGYYVLASSRTDIAMPPLDVAIGAVPTRNLDIPDEDMVDGWGNRFTYVVTMKLATSTTSGSLPDPTQGGITVNDSHGNPYLSPPNSANYLVISYGGDNIISTAGSGGGGAGAYEANPPTFGTAPTKPCSAASTLEANNCTFENGGLGSFVNTLLTGTNFHHYVSVGTANSGMLTSGVQVVPGITYPTAVANGALFSGAASFADCPTGYIAVACSGVTATGSASCQGNPAQPDPTPTTLIPPGPTASACQYTCSGGTYNFYTTCVRF